VVTPEEINGALDAMLEYFMENIAGREGTEGEAILDRLARLHEDGTYTLKEAADYALQLVIAGSDTTANMGALGVMVLLEHPDQLAELTAPGGEALWGNTIEELLRYLNVNQNGLRRVTTGEIELEGLTIPADRGLILAHDAGNRDAAAFADPQAFDIHRHARHHIAFGDGIHQCLGQGYARLELTVLFETLFRRIPTIRLAVPREELEFRTEMGIYGVDRLPVTWEGRSA
jgi:cytochrome P450